MFENRSRVTTAILSLLILSDIAGWGMRATDAVGLVATLSIIAAVAAVMWAAGMRDDQVRWTNAALLMMLMIVIAFRLGKLVVNHSA